MIRKSVASIAVLVTFLSVGGPASAGSLVPEPVVTGKTDQFGPGAEGDTWVGWTQYVKPTFTAHIRMQDGADHRSFRRRDGSHSFFGGFDPTNDDVIFQDAKGANSNLYLYHVDTDDFGAPPAGINTDLWEWAPDISTAYILFGRNNFTNGSSPWRIVLYDRALQTFQVLDSVENRCGCIWPEAVTDRYAAWTKCEARCHVFVYDTLTDTRTRVPNPDKQQYAAALSEDGQVYFVRSGNSCDANPRILRYTIDTDETAFVFAYPNGTNLVSGLDLVDGADLNDDLYFDRAACNDERYRGNIYRIRDVFTTVPPPTISGEGSSSEGRSSGSGAWRGPERPGARPVR
jgi:hypothetical protein